jgi:hypothetical protein
MANFNFKTVDSIVTADYKLGDQKLRLWIDRDALTPKKMREINEGIKSDIQVETGMQVEAANTTAMAKTLDLVINDWKVVTPGGALEPVEFNGAVAAPDFEFFDNLSVKFLGDLLKFCMEQINPKQMTATP